MLPDTDAFKGISFVIFFHRHISYKARSNFQQRQSPYCSQFGVLANSMPLTDIDMHEQFRKLCDLDTNSK